MAARAKKEATAPKALATTTPTREPDDAYWEKQTAPARTEAQRVLAMALKVKDLANDEQYVNAAEGLLDIVERQKKIDEEKKASVGKIEAGLKVIKGWFKSAIDPYVKAEEHLRNELQLYRRRRIDKQNEALQKASDIGDVAPDKARELVAASRGFLAPDVGGIGWTNKTAWTVTDFEKLPAEFKKLVIDTDKLDAYVSVHGLEAKIPGVVVSDASSPIVTPKNRSKAAS